MLIDQLPPLSHLATRSQTVLAWALGEVAMPAPAFQREFERSVMSREGIAQRVDLALDALRAEPGPATAARRRVAANRSKESS